MVAELNRQDILADHTLVGTVFCRAFSRRTDEWLQSIYQDCIGDDDRFALVATGGYSRSILTPFSDLDLLLLHENVDFAELESRAQRLWYPVWDAGVDLGHAVRTVKEAVALGRTDLDTATSQLGVRHLAGNVELRNRLNRKTEAQWKKQHRTWLPLLARQAVERGQQQGEVAYLVEPELKNGRGGLRDADAIRWAVAAGIELLEQERREVRDAGEVLLAARVELHRTSGNRSDKLRIENQDEVAEALGLEAEDMMASIARAGRTIRWIGDDVWNRAARAGRRKIPIFGRRTKVKEASPGVLIGDGTVSLRESAAPAADPLLLFRVALLAAEQRARIDRHTLDRLAAEATLTSPWPDEARDLFVKFLATGHAAIPVMEALDHTGTWLRLFPEWTPCQNRPQRNAYHTYSVDRHLTEAAAQASFLVDQVDRPDLLLVGALFHDIGKGYAGDHSIVGIDHIASVARRMGFPESDVATLEALVEHHLVLPDAATRYDVSDPGTVRAVTEKATSVLLLQLLTALTEADSIATGPSAWSTGKAGLLRQLAANATRALQGESLDDLPRDFPTAEQLAIVAAEQMVVIGESTHVTVVARDSPGLFSHISGALAVNGLDVLEGAIHTAENKWALLMFIVEDSLGNVIEWPPIEADIRMATEGELPIEERLERRIRDYGLFAGEGAAAAAVSGTFVRFNTRLAENHTVVEVAAPNQVGLLYRLAGAITSLECTIDQARVQTLNDGVVDTFYFRDWHGRKVTDEDKLEQIRQALIGAIRTEGAVTG